MLSNLTELALRHRLLLPYVVILSTTVESCAHSVAILLQLTSKGENRLVQVMLSNVVIHTTILEF